MGIIAAITLFFTSYGTGMTAWRNSDCVDIIDIYYPKHLEYKAYDKDCRYTRTEITCNFDCDAIYVSRRYYDRLMQPYIDLDMEVPFPKRTDKDRIFAPSFSVQ